VIFRHKIEPETAQKLEAMVSRLCLSIENVTEVARDALQTIRKGRITLTWEAGDESTKEPS